MFDVILATTNDGGIGLNGRMAWRCPEELKLFQQKTNNSILIVGRRTAQNLPKLENRTIFCVTNNEKLRTTTYKNPVTPFLSFMDAVNSATKYERKIFVAGGAQIYNLVFSKHKELIDAVHLSVMKKNYMTDVKVEFDKSKYLIKETYDGKDFDHYVFVNGKSEETQYLNLLRDVKANGVPRDGRNGETVAKFTEHLKFDLRKGFPLLTTKRMYWKAIVEELLFFLRGDTNSKVLEEKNIKIWNGNTNREFLDNNGFEHRQEGVMGPMYGYQWRHFGAQYDEKSAKPMETGIDQIKEVIDQIRESPHSRRHLVVERA